MIKIKGIIGKIVIAVLLISTITSSAVAIYMYNSKEEKKVLAPEHAKPEIEEYAEPFGNQYSEKYEQSKPGSGAVDIIYQKDIKIDLSTNKVLLLFGNPSQSNHDMLIQIIIKDVLISESGMIKAGNQIKELDVLDGVKERLTSGEYVGEIRVSFYDCISAEKVMVDVNIPLRIVVE